MPQSSDSITQRGMLPCILEERRRASQDLAPEHRTTITGLLCLAVPTLPNQHEGICTATTTDRMMRSVPLLYTYLPSFIRFFRASSNLNLRSSKEISSQFLLFCLFHSLDTNLSTVSYLKRCPSSILAHRPDAAPKQGTSVGSSLNGELYFAQRNWF